MSVPRIDASGCGFWPTAQASDWKGPNFSESGSQSTNGLATAVARGGATRQTWATPDTGHSISGHGMRGGNAGNGHQSGQSLQNQVKWATPEVACALGGHLSRGGKRKDELLLGGQAKETSPGQKGSLSPLWCAWLMGWPVGWEDASLGSQWECPNASTDCEHLATVRCLNAWLRRSRTWLDRLE